MNRRFCPSYVGVIFLAFLLVSVSSFADEVKTSVTLDATISQLWRARHHSKWFKCWGEPDEIKVWENALAAESTELSGTLGLNFDNPEESFGAFNPVSSEWVSELTDDRTFHLEFSQDLTTQMSKTFSTKCNTLTWHSRLNMVSNTFKSNASIVIPPGVYMIRVRRTQLEETHLGLTSKIINAQRVINDGTLAQAPETEVEVGVYDYFLVQPGQRIDFNVVWQSEELEDAHFKVSYEIKMMGTELCAENLWDPEKVKGTAILPHVQSLFTKERLKSKRHEVIAGLSCLRNPAYVNSFLKENHGSDLVSFLKALGDTLVQLNTEEVTPGDFHAEFMLTARMTLFEVSRNILRDLNAFCSIETVLLLFPDQAPLSIPVRGYHYASRIYYKIKLDLAQAPTALLSDFANILVDLGKQGVTYERAKQDSSSKRLEDLHYLIFSGPFRTNDIVRTRLSLLPTLKSGATGAENIQAALSRGDMIFSDLEVELLKILRAFARGDKNVIDASAFRELAAQYKNQLTELGRLLQTDIDWFAIEGAGDFSHSKFTESLFILNNDLMNVTGTNLDYLFGKRLGLLSPTNFLQIQKMKTLHQEVNACILEAAP